MLPESLTILLVEDNPDDILFVQQATGLGGQNHTVHAVAGGEEAMRYLLGQDTYADRRRFPLPQVILTDLKMPGVDGFSLLRWLRTQAQLSLIPVIAFSSSPHTSDIQTAYELGANCYIVKPTGLERLVEMLSVVYNFWSLCEHPPVAA